MYNVPNDWKLGNYMELSPDEKLKWLYNATQELEDEISQLGGSDVSVTAEYTQQTYNNKLATITVDDTPTDIYAPKVDVTNLLDDGGSLIANVKIGSTTKAIRMPSTVVEGSQIVFPARVLLALQTALAQITTTMSYVQVYHYDYLNEDDIALAEEMISDIENGRTIYPTFDLPAGTSIGYPVSMATVYDAQSGLPIKWDLNYKIPFDFGGGIFYDLYVRLLLEAPIEGYTDVSGYTIGIYGVMYNFS